MPIHHNVKQNSQEWYEKRAGVLTASVVDKLITPAKLELAKGDKVDALMYKLIADSMVTEQYRRQGEFGNYWTKWGHEQERNTVSDFEFVTGIQTTVSGFWTTDDGLAGASLDREVGKEGTLEAKSPAPQTIVSYAHIEGTLYKEYAMQVQFQLWVTGRKFGWIVAGHPAFAPIIEEFVVDAKYTDAFDKHIPAFLKRMSEARAEIGARWKQ